jgi:hypothetical protein
LEERWRGEESRRKPSMDPSDAPDNLHPESEPNPWDKDAVQVDDKLILHLAVYSWKVQAIRTTMPLCNPRDAAWRYLHQEFDSCWYRLE